MLSQAIISNILASNAQWANDVEAAVPGFHTEAAKGQSPKVLWIGCADSRVPPSVVTASPPGDIFVHRNIGNQFFAKDDNAISVLTYAVDDLGVDHILVVGHTQCGGVAACYAAASASPGPSPDPSGSALPPPDPKDPLRRWLAPLTDLAREQLAHAHGDEELAAELRKLVEANVRAQVANVAATDIVRAAWARGRDVRVHGWVYHIETGKLSDLGCSVSLESMGM